MRKELYRVPHDRIVTDVFVEWQDGVRESPQLRPADEPPSKGAGATATRRSTNSTLGHVAEGLPIPPPEHILTRRGAYMQEAREFAESRKRREEGESGALTTQVTKILVEASEHALTASGSR